MFYNIQYDDSMDISVVCEEKSLNGKLELKQKWHEVTFFSNSIAQNYLEFEQNGIIHGLTEKGNVTLLNAFKIDPFFKTKYHIDYMTSTLEVLCEFALFGRKHVSEEDIYYGIRFNLTPQSSSELFVPNDDFEAISSIQKSLHNNRIFDYDPLPDKFETNLGDISISFGSSGSLGWDSSLRSYAIFKIDFEHPVRFDKAYEVLVKMKLFLSMYLGYIPELENIEAYIEKKPDFENTLKVFPPRKGFPQKSNHLHVPCIIKRSNPNEFIETMQNWLARYSDRENAIRRFACDFWIDRTMEDRVVSVVNMFDLLPAEAKITRKPLPSELVKEIDGLMKTAKRTMMGDDRKDMMCSAISRLKEMNRLKIKIQSRFEVIFKHLEKPITEDCINIIEDMVDLRNQYVHGSECKRRTKYPEGRMVSTLNFGFCVSELIECGWKPKHHDLLQMFKFSVTVI